jgi:hypothetical protein
MPDGQQVFLYPSSNVANSATGPAASATVATLTPLAGLHDIEVWLAVSGTSVVAADSNNMKVSFGSVDLAKFLPYSSTTAGTTNAAGPYRYRLFCDGTTALAVKAVANATATAVYAAHITATRVGP